MMKKPAGKEQRKEPDPQQQAREEIQDSFQKALSKKKWENALRELKRWMELEPENLHLHVKMAELFAKMGERKEALRKYWEAVQRYFEAGLYRQAKALNQIILRMAPNIPQARKMALDIDAKMGFYKHPLFKDMPEEEFGEIVRNTVMLKVPKDTMVIREGERGDSLYMICSGAVDVYIKNKKKGIADRVARLGKDNFFGEGGFLTGKPRSASIIASEETELLELSKKYLDEAVSKYPRVGEIIRRYHDKRNRKGSGS